MTGFEWKRRCAERILRSVTKAGINGMRLRALRRATSYNRAPEGIDGVEIWGTALDELQRRKQVVIEWTGAEDSGNASAVIFTTAFKAARDICLGVSNDKSLTAKG